MTPLDQAITALGDIQCDLFRERKYLQSSEARFTMPHIVSHISLAREMLKRARTAEDATVERLFDMEVDISDHVDEGTAT